MIARRRPILSAIANRRMFMGGGMVAPMPQPTYMDLMPQQMGIPREAQGIMASSQPLVDAIAGDANNPAGGDTLSMAPGGLAAEELAAKNFRIGGFGQAQAQPMIGDVPAYLGRTEMIRPEIKTVPTDPINPGRSTTSFELPDTPAVSPEFRGRDLTNGGFRLR